LLGIGLEGERIKRLKIASKIASKKEITCKTIEVEI